MHPYIHSPKAVLIAGAPAAGKSTVARAIRDRFGHALLSLDQINSEVAAELGIQIKDLRQPRPEIVKAYKARFLKAIRDTRFANMVIEGLRLSHPHVFDTFTSALRNAYGDYTLMGCFYLNPSVEARQKQYMLRQAQLAKRAAKDRDPRALELLKHEYDKGFVDHLEPPLPGFQVVENPDLILDLVAQTLDAKHPALKPEHEELITFIAESGTFNPFYQRVEVGGDIVIQGFTDSEQSWRNILKLGIDYRGKKVCDIGCMHGYFTFKLEEAGALSVGVDIDPGSITAAQRIAEARGSKARFLVLDSAQGFSEPFDIIFALNVLHRVRDFETVCRNIFTSAQAAVLEVGEVQLKDLFILSKSMGFKMRQTLKSHRCSDVVGQRAVIHLVKA